MRTQKGGPSWVCGNQGKLEKQVPYDQAVELTSRKSGHFWLEVEQAMLPLSKERVAKCSSSFECESGSWENVRDRRGFAKDEIPGRGIKRRDRCPRGEKKQAYLAFGRRSSTLDHSLSVSLPPKGTGCIHVSISIKKGRWDWYYHLKYHYLGQALSQVHSDCGKIKSFFFYHYSEMKVHILMWAEEGSRPLVLLHRVKNPLFPTSSTHQSSG
jgi:hypothetical protein